MMGKGKESQNGTIPFCFALLEKPGRSCKMGLRKDGERRDNVLQACKLQSASSLHFFFLARFGTNLILVPTSKNNLRRKDRSLSSAPDYQLQIMLKLYVWRIRINSMHKRCKR